jgi:serine/threonine protein kinase
MPEARGRLKLKSVNFSWQKGVKVGQGRFGKVYTAVNLKTGEMLAMKELPLTPSKDPENKMAVTRLLSEIRLFENISHPNLVRYYGVEILRVSFSERLKTSKSLSNKALVKHHFGKQIDRTYFSNNPTIKVKSEVNFRSREGSFYGSEDPPEEVRILPTK